MNDEIDNKRRYYAMKEGKETLIRCQEILKEECFGDNILNGVIISEDGKAFLLVNKVSLQSAYDRIRKANSQLSNWLEKNHVIANRDSTSYIGLIKEEIESKRNFAGFNKLTIPLKSIMFIISEMAQMRADFNCKMEECEDEELKRQAENNIHVVKND